VSNDIRIRGYVSKPKGVWEQELESLSHGVRAFR